MVIRKISWLVGVFIISFGLVACSNTQSTMSEGSTKKSGSSKVSNHEDKSTEKKLTENKQEVHWGYGGAGAPENWAKIDKEYELCASGTEQSPIDLTGATLSNLEDIVFNYKETTVNILNNGHTIQVNYDEGSSIAINGHTYNLRQFHFHAPSEHAINGKLYPAEMHLVHADAEKKLAVVGIFIDEGKENAAFAPVWDNMPTAKSDSIATGVSVNAVDLLPTKQVVYRYDGSLTTPPCSEGVLWSVMESPVEMSAEQIALFTNIFQGNNRPLQPLNKRSLLIDKTN